MKNYFTQLQELKTAKERLNVLEQKKELYLVRATDVTSKLKEVVISGGASTDKMADYVIKCEIVNKEIEELKEEIGIMEAAINKMDSYLNEIRYKSDTERRVFIYYYKDNRTPKEISLLIPCGIATVYRKLEKIEKILKNDKK